MEYLKHVLERSTSNVVEVQRLFDFIHELTFESSHRASRLMNEDRRNVLFEFEMKWKEKFPSSAYIAYIDGCWLPKLFDESEIHRQLKWPHFINKYREISTTSSSLNESGSQGKAEAQMTFNFAELGKIPIWEEMYNLHGSSLVKFILDSCVIVLPIEESFYLAVCRRNTLFHKRLSFLENGRYQPRNGMLGVVPTNRILDSSFQKYSGNPYETVEIKKASPIGKPQKLLNNQIKRKRRGKRGKKRQCTKYGKDSSKLETQENESYVPPAKRSRLENESSMWNDTNPTDNSNVRPSHKTSEDERNKTSNITAPKTPRWVTPKGKTLEMIVKAREEEKQTKGLTSSSSLSKSKCRPTAKSNQHIFINILDDKYFKGKLYLVTKEVHCITSSDQSKLPQKLNGLRLPKCTKYPAELTIHRMSETAARKFGLQINPRKRRRRKTSIELPFDSRHKEQRSVLKERPVMEPKIRSCEQVSESARKVVKKDAAVVSELLGQPPLKKLKMADKPKDTTHPQNFIIHETCQVAFSATLALSTSEVLHNKFCGNRWPDTSGLGKALSFSDQDESIQFLMSKILDWSVLDSEDQQSKAAIDKLRSEGKLRNLEANLKSIIKFHNRAKDLIKLMKNCVMFWSVNLGKKLTMKEEQRQARVKRIAKRASHQKRIDVIDLTQDTSSTNFSGSPHVLSSPLSLSAVKASGSEVNMSAPSIPHLSSFLSTTPTKSQSQKERKKLAFSKLKESISPNCIISAISQILFLSGASNILESNSNRQGFLTFIRKSIFLGGLKSALHLGQLMSLLSSSSCSWLKDIDDLILRNHIFAKTMAWLFSEYILVMLKMCFYITERSNTRFQLGFYLRDNWRSISDRLRNQFMRNGTLEKFSGTVGKGSTASGRMRLIPKKNFHVRPILSLTKQINKKINVHDCKLLLTYINGLLADHGSNDASSFRKRWKMFLNSWQSRKCSVLYYIRVDIRDAYPSVKMDKLRQILTEACSNEEQVIAKRFLIVGSKNQYRTALTNISRSTRNWYAPIYNRPCIVLDTEKDSSFNKSKTLESLLSTLTSNVITIGNCKFNLSFGLPQGWSLSQALCNIYYGHMDITHFSEFLNNENEFFIRSVDDYFYVSPDALRVAKFFHRMKCGIPDYNCNINPEKSVTNLLVSSSVPVPLSANEWVVFCGWRFCLFSGQIMRDFSSYAGLDFCSTLTFLLQKCASPEQFIYRRMGFIGPARLKYLIIDPAINCRERILLTIYEAGLVFAFRFYAACRVLFKNLNSVADQGKGFHLFRSIVWCALNIKRYICRNNIHLYSSENIARHRCPAKTKTSFSSRWSEVPQSTPTTFPKSKENAQSCHPVCADPISELEVSLLVYLAFYRKLSIHSSNFNHTILPKLKRRIHKLKFDLVSLSHYNYLLEIIGRSLPTHFQDIKI